MDRTGKLLATTMIAAAGAISAALTFSATAAAEPAPPPNSGRAGSAADGPARERTGHGSPATAEPRVGLVRGSGCAGRPSGTPAHRQCGAHLAAARGCARCRRPGGCSSRHRASDCAHPGPAGVGTGRHHAGRHRAGRRPGDRTRKPGADGRGERARRAIPSGAAAARGFIPGRPGFADARRPSGARSGSQACSGRRPCRCGPRCGRNDGGPGCDRPRARAAAGRRAAVTATPTTTTKS